MCLAPLCPQAALWDEGFVFSHKGFHVREAGVGMNQRQMLFWGRLALPLA